MPGSSVVAGDGCRRLACYTNHSLPCLTLNPPLHPLPCPLPPPPQRAPPAHGRRGPHSSGFFPLLHQSNRPGGLAGDGR
jgi:hypothetical protein